MKLKIFLKKAVKDKMNEQDWMVTISGEAIVANKFKDTLLEERETFGNTIHIKQKDAKVCIQLKIERDENNRPKIKLISEGSYDARDASSIEKILNDAINKHYK
jgi:hypothetical protein